MPTGTRFGQFFKQCRSALGLTLREFCRRNGFDPGNISRLERSLLLPPQSRELLEAYAKSLKLQLDSHEWHTFFDLAAAETGRIPPQMMANQAVLESLPQVFRKLRGQGRRHRTETKALNLEEWADSYEASFTLPQLVRRLIHATVESLVRIDMPAGEGVRRPGWDGVVETTQGNAFVPSGISGWEMGVESDPRRKAEEDFQKRARVSHGLDRSQMSFVFVTPRKWLKKTEWFEKKKQLGIWKDVRAYDSANLEEWLEIAPAVDVWFARQVGRRPEGVTDIDEHWENLAALTHPPLKPEVFLASRESAIEALTQWLAGPPGACAFEARSPVEVLDLVAAHVANLDQEQHEALAARILIVAEREAWSALAATRNRLILIPRPSLAVEPEMVAEAVRQGHHVLLCSHRFATAHMATHKLPPPYRDDLERALISSGLHEEQARRCAREAGGSLTVLKRRLTHLASTRQPEWSRPLEAVGLVPVLLAGSWDHNCTADRTVIETLAGPGHTYAEVLSVAHRWLQEEDPPVMRVLTRWSLVSREDSWLLLAPHITPQQLDTFEEVAIAVLGEDDPQYELPPHERWYAALRHKLPQYSSQLRTGLAETLALLGTRSDTGLIRDAVGPVTRAERVVQSVMPAHASWQRWASLSDYLPLFAEACPEVFLDAVERDLRGSKALIQLFKQEGGLLSGSSSLTDLLWAFETLAWKSSLLSRVSLILAQLVQDAPGEQLAARLQNRLREIFLSWLPQTTASVETCIRVLNLLMRKCPDAAWHLLLSLLPRRLEPINYTHQPRWRDWALNGMRDSTPAERQQQVEACANLLLSNIDQSLERREQLLTSLERLPLAAQQRFLEDLQAFARTSLDTETRGRLTDKIRGKVHLHRHFSHTRWALPPHVVDTLEGLQRQFEPQDIVAQDAWLFSHYISYIFLKFLREEQLSSPTCRFRGHLNQWGIAQNSCTR